MRSSRTLHCNHLFMFQPSTHNWHANYSYQNKNKHSVHVLLQITVTIHRLKCVNVPFAPAAVPLPLYSQQKVASGWLPSPLCQQATLTNPPVLPGTFLTAGDQHRVCDLVHSARNKRKLKIIIICNDTHNWFCNRCIMKKVMVNTKDTSPHTIT